MIYLKSGLNHSMVILELMRNDEDLQNIDIAVGCFTNCRETGLTFTVNHGLNIQRTWCIYEDRNVDNIVLNHNDLYCGVNGDLPYKDAESRANDVEFGSCDYVKCFEHLKKLIIERTDGAISVFDKVIKDAREVYTSEILKSGKSNLAIQKVVNYVNQSHLHLTKETIIKIIDKIRIIYGIK